MTKRKYIKFSEEEEREQFHEDDMTISEFEKYMKETYKVTKSGYPISNAYIHTLLNYGHLPKHMGGNKLYITSVKGVVAIRLQKEKHKFNVDSGKTSPTQRKRGRKLKKGAKKVYIYRK